MRYHQGRVIRQHALFMRSCKVCGTAIIVLVGLVILAAV